MVKYFILFSYLSPLLVRNYLYQNWLTHITKINRCILTNSGQDNEIYRAFCKIISVEKVILVKSRRYIKSTNYLNFNSDKCVCVLIDKIWTIYEKHTYTYAEYNPHVVTVF